MRSWDASNPPSEHAAELEPETEFDAGRRPRRRGGRAGGGGGVDVGRVGRGCRPLHLEPLQCATPPPPPLADSLSPTLRPALAGVSSLWDWATTRNDGSDSEQSTGSRSSSRAAALWNWRNGAASPPPSEPGSRQSSVHGGSQFEGSQKGGAGLWFWRNGHSREASAHGANAYHAAIAAARGGALPPGGPLHSPEEGSQSPRKDGSLASVGSSTSLWSWANGGSTPDSDAEHSVSGGGGWNWANGRVGPPPDSNDSSMHGQMPHPLSTLTPLLLLLLLLLLPLLPLLPLVLLSTAFAARAMRLLLKGALD